MPAIPIRRLIISAVTAVLASITLLASTAAQAASQPGTTAPCPTATTTDAGCALSISAPPAAGSGTSPAPLVATAPSGLSPADLQQAYNLQGSTSGSGQTVAVVTPYDDPGAASDLAAYRSQYGLSPCTVADGCFKQVSQTGASTLPGTSANWDATEAASVDVISAICPNCHITVVEASSAAIADLGAAENEAASLGATSIDNDWFVYESSAETTYDTSYFSHPGVAITAPSGDNSGYGVTYPAASPDVTAVGGTTLTADSSSPRGYDEAAWTNSGSGCSQYEAKPSWQTDAGCTTRSLNDLAADAGTPVAFYDTPTEAGWGTATGTAVSSAVIAATYALAGTPGSSDNPAEYPYEHPGGSYTTPGNAYTSADGLTNITSGSDGTCSASYLCTAGAGYNGPTGLGSPDSTVSLTSTGGQTGVFYSGVAGKCIDLHNSQATAGDKIDLYSCNGTDAQDWTAEPDGTLSITIPTSDTNGTPGTGCLGLTGGATAEGTDIELVTCDATSAADQWTPMADGQLRNAASGYCLDDPSVSVTNGTQLDLWPCNTGYNQVWTAPYTRPSKNGFPTSKETSHKCIADIDDKLTNGNPITINSCLGNAAQFWTIRADGFLQLEGETGCITPSGDGTVNGTLLVYEPCSGDPSQHWTEESDGSMANTHAPGYCMADPNADDTNGTQLQLSPCNHLVQQTWNIPNPQR